MRGKNDERIGKQQKEYDDGDVFFHTWILHENPNKL